MPKPWVKNYLVTPQAVEHQPEEPGPTNGVAFAGFGETRIHVNPDIVDQPPAYTPVTGYLESVKSGIKQADDIIPTEKKPKGRLSRIITPGPIDPLTQQPSLAPSDIDDKAMMLHLLMKIGQSLDSILVATRTQRPILPAKIAFDGLIGGAMQTGVPIKAWFQIEGKNVPALKVAVQNNTANPLYVDFDKNATPGSFVVPTYTSLSGNGLLTFDVSCDTISLLVTTGTPGLNNLASGGIVVRAWTNPEWRNMWGQ